MAENSRTKFSKSFDDRDYTNGIYSKFFKYIFNIKILQNRGIKDNT